MLINEMFEIDKNILVLGYLRHSIILIRIVLTNEICTYFLFRIDSIFTQLWLLLKVIKKISKGT